MRVLEVLEYELLSGQRAPGRAVVSTRGSSHIVSGWWTRCTRDGAHAVRGGCLRGQRLQLATIGCASRLKQRYLVNANLHLGAKPFVIGKQLRNGFLHKPVRSVAGLGGEGVKLGTTAGNHIGSRRLFFTTLRCGYTTAPITQRPAPSDW